MWSHLLTEALKGADQMAVAPNSVDFSTIKSNLSPLGKPTATVTWTGNSDESVSNSISLTDWSAGEIISDRPIFPSSKTKRN